MAQERKWLAVLVLAALLLAPACDEEGRRKTEVLAKKLQMHAWFHRRPLYGVTADTKNPGKHYAVCDESSGICIVNEPVLPKKQMPPVNPNVRSLTIGIGEQNSVHITFEASKEPRIFEIIVATNDYAYHDFLADGSYDLRSDFRSKRTFALLDGKWVELVPAIGERFRRQMKSSGEWLYFDKKARIWKREA